MVTFLVVGRTWGNREVTTLCKTVGVKQNAFSSAPGDAQSGIVAYRSYRMTRPGRILFTGRMNRNGTARDALDTHVDATALCGHVVYSNFTQCGR